MTLTPQVARARPEGGDDLALADVVAGFRSLRDDHKRAGAVLRPADELEHLRVALQAAVTLEFATLPPYLCALWSVKDELSYVANSLRQIVQEEMLHLALAANMLVSIGGHPKIASALPVYPGKLPLDVHPELTVHLSGLTSDALATFLEIERPHHPGHHVSLNAARDLSRFHEAEEGAGGEDKEETIGEFYDHIVAAFRRNSFEQSTDRQITAPLASMVVKDPDDVERAVGKIQREGEGSDGPADTGPYNLAHYYRFAEIIELKQLVYDPATELYSFGTAIDFDMAADVWPMAPVPEGGYPPSAIADPEVARLLDGFSRTYSRLVDLLQAVWESDAGQAALWHGIDAMFELERYAKPLMQIPRPDGGGSYGPDFRYMATSEP